MTSSRNGSPSGSELQSLLAGLLDLELAVQHAHWNCYGAGFRELHLHLQVIAEAVGAKADAVAEYALTRRVSPDGRAASIVAGSPLRAVPPGPIQVDRAIADVVGVIDDAVAMCRAYLRSFGPDDAVGNDLIVSAVALLEHHHWMLIAEFSSDPPALPPGGDRPP